MQRPVREWAQPPHRISGDVDDALLRLHRITERNTTQRITIVRRSARQTRPRCFDVILTRAQVLELIDDLMDRIDLMSDDLPE